MPGPTLASLIVALASALVAAGPADSAPKSAARRVADARRALADRHPVLAVAELEAALGDPALAADKPAVLGLLRQSYGLAAEQADAAGRPLDADSYRENARILARKAGPTSPPPASATPATAAPAPSPAPAIVAPPATIEEPPVDVPPPMPEVAADPTPAPLAAEAAAPTPVAAPTPAPETAPPPGPGLAEADAAFRAGAEADAASRAGKLDARPLIRKSYAEAGRIYEHLAEQNRLPDDRRAHWAYCRSVAVAQRIAANPKTEAEWRQVDAEIEQIRALAPDNWLGNYLRNKASSRPSARKLARAGSPIVRAASPEEPPTRPAPTSARGIEPAAPPAVVAVPPAAAPTSTPRWQIRESANFKVFHVNNAATAEKAVQVAEATRRDQTRRWSGSPAAAPWQPKCEIYLYPTADQYARMTGQPPDSPGFSTMGMNEGQIISRRVNLRVDHDGLLGAVLPHEVTHVILADFFPEQQIPRWADEGMAVLTEPAAEQKRRAADLVEPIHKNLLFTMTDLMNMDYPDNAYWSLYYAQSVSLTRFLVEQGTPAQFIEFLQGAQRRGFEAELRRTYKIDGFVDLQARWVTYARAHLDDPAAPPTATAANTPRRETRSR